MSLIPEEQDLTEEQLGAVAGGFALAAAGATLLAVAIVDGTLDDIIDTVS